MYQALLSSPCACGMKLGLTDASADSQLWIILYVLLTQVDRCTAFYVHNNELLKEADRTTQP